MDPRCKETTRHGTVCGGVDAHVPGCPKNPLKEEFERQDEGRVRKLEERLAREAMGWVRAKDVDGAWRQQGRFWLTPRTGMVYINGYHWHPWTSAEDALECLEASREDWSFARVGNEGRNWRVQRDEPSGIYSPPYWASTQPQAICLALEAWLDAKEKA